MSIVITIKSNATQDTDLISIKERIAYALKGKGIDVVKIDVVEGGGKKRKIKRKLRIDPKEGLEAAILKVAKEDYIDALIEQTEDRESLKNNREVRRLEKFFLGDWGQSLSYGQGELIIEKCRREAYGGGTAQ